MNCYQNLQPYQAVKLEEIEKSIYDEVFFFKKNVNKVVIDIEEILKREVLVFSDYDYNLPQNIFCLNSKSFFEIVGRKIISPLWFEKKINALNCSMITAPMLLGFLKKRSKKGRKIVIEYFPFSNEEKQGIFDCLKKDLTTDILYPYSYRDFKTGSEKVSPKAGWSFSVEKKIYLGEGEKHIRKFTEKYFLNFDLNGKVVYDPACSTGQFLFSFKKNHPNIFTIGHDLSDEMVNYASRFVDEACCCNALNSPLDSKTVDIMFLRFLNGEIVTTKTAYKMMRSLAIKVKKKGLIVAFGHTPFLIREKWLVKNNFKILNKVGYDRKCDAIFQYYVLEIGD